jgi:PAS domain S-box-containing protein
LQATDFKYDLFFELTPDLMCIAGYDGYFRKINSAVSKTLGYSMDELYSRPINDFVHEGDKDITAKVRHELTRSKPLLNFENRYVRKDGEIVWLSWTSLPLE